MTELNLNDLTHTERYEAIESDYNIFGTYDKKWKRERAREVIAKYTKLTTKEIMAYSDFELQTLFETITPEIIEEKNDDKKLFLFLVITGWLSYALLWFIG